MKLSILICTTYDRRPLFNVLYEHILAQCTDEVEVLFEEDNKEISVGAKRQKLLDRAQGDYVVFHDSDDWCPDYYVDEILKAISKEPDSIGFEISCTGTEGKTASASNKWKDWKDNEGGFDYVRTPYQKTPVKREIALAIGYKDMRWGEDFDYSKRLKQSGLIKSEVYIPKVMYMYRYTYEDPRTKFNMK